MTASDLWLLNYCKANDRLLSTQVVQDGSRSLNPSDDGSGHDQVPGLDTVEQCAQDGCRLS